MLDILLIALIGGLSRLSGLRRLHAGSVQAPDLYLKNHLNADLALSFN